MLLRGWLSSLQVHLSAVRCLVNLLANCLYICWILGFVYINYHHMIYLSRSYCSGRGQEFFFLNWERSYRISSQTPSTEKFDWKVHAHFLNVVFRTIFFFCKSTGANVLYDMYPQSLAWDRIWKLFCDSIWESKIHLWVVRTSSPSCVSNFT